MENVDVFVESVILCMYTIYYAYTYVCIFCIMYFEML
jgi:hypothetical protein